MGWGVGNDVVEDLTLNVIPGVILGMNWVQVK